MEFQLILSDVDSTLIEQEVIDLLGEYAGKGAEVADITSRAMAGNLDFKSALEERVGLLAGQNSSILKEVTKRITLSPGALELKEYCRRKGIMFGAVTGGFLQVLSNIEFFQDLDYVAGNSLEIDAGVLTGKVIEPIIDRQAKADHLRSFALRYGVDIEKTIAIGDGANDLLMIQSAGLGVAYNAKPILRDAAKLSIQGNLKELIRAISH